jgi:DNA replication protein DnaC
MMTNTLKQHIQNLHLSGLLSSLELRLQEAEANRLPYAQFLELLLQDEINVRHQRMLARRRKSADFREPRSLENFDFGFNPSINRAQIYELAACQFVRQHRDVLLVGPPGVGTMPGARLCRSVVAVWLKSKDPDVKGPAYSGGISRDR